MQRKCAVNTTASSTETVAITYYSVRGFYNNVRLILVSYSPSLRAALSIAPPKEQNLFHIDHGDGLELANHGVLPVKGRDEVFWTIAQQGMHRLVKFNGRPGELHIRVTPGIMVAWDCAHPNDERCYKMGCRMIFVGIGLMYGLTHYVRDTASAHLAELWGTMDRLPKN